MLSFCLYTTTFACYEFLLSQNYDLPIISSCVIKEVLHKGSCIQKFGHNSQELLLITGKLVVCETIKKINLLCVDNVSPKSQNYAINFQKSKNQMFVLAFCWGNKLICSMLLLCVSIWLQT